MKKAIEIIGGVLGALFFIGVFWAMFWVACAMSDQCWYSYTGQL